MIKNLTFTVFYTQKITSKKYQIEKFEKITLESKNDFL